jgi:phenylalanyl-tRNA synthetase beta subunit
LDYQSDFIKNVYIFDYFKNEKKEEIKIGFRFIFQSKDKTITSTQMDEVYSDIVKKSLGIGGVSIPGLFIDR